MKTIIPYFLLIAVIVALVLMYFYRDSGHNQALKAERNKTQITIDSMANLVRKSDSAGYMAFKRCQEGRYK